MLQKLGDIVRLVQDAFAIVGVFGRKNIVTNSVAIDEETVATQSRYVEPSAAGFLAQLDFVAK